MKSLALALSMFVLAGGMVYGVSNARQNKPSDLYVYVPSLNCFLPEEDAEDFGSCIAGSGTCKYTLNPGQTADCNPSHYTPEGSGMQFQEN